MSLRLFVALVPPDAVAHEVARARAQVARALPGVRLRGSGHARSHLTLCFLGDTDEGALPALTTAVRGVARGAAPLMVRTGGLGAFPSWRRPTVTWLGLDGGSEALATLHRELLDALPAEVRHQGPARFVPHLTVARLPTLDERQRAALRRAADGFHPETVPWDVREVALLRSELHPDGARHTTLVRAGLAGADEGAPPGNGAW